jgi:hypothetical protein
MRDEVRKEESRIKTKSGSPPFIMTPYFWLLNSVFIHPSSLRPHPLVSYA